MHEPPWVMIIARIIGVVSLVAVLVFTFMPMMAKAATIDPSPEQVTIETLLSRVAAKQEDQVTYAEETRTLLSEAVEMFKGYVNTESQLETWNMVLQAFTVGLFVVVIFAITWGN